MNDLYFKVLTHAENALVCGKICEKSYQPGLMGQQMRNTMNGMLI